MKLSKLSGVFHHIALFICPDMVRQLYYAYVFPHISYGIELYGAACKTNLTKIQVAQNLLLKALTKCKRRDSATALHQKLNIPNVGEIYSLTILIFVHKQYSNLAPCVFNQFYKLNSEIMREDRMQIYSYQHIKIGLERTL